MRLARAVLLIVDISGYTEFIVKRRISLLHAEQIIGALLEAVIDKAEPPLILNKLEGDAAFLYCEYDEDPTAVVEGVMRQLRALFEAFETRLEGMRQGPEHCDCSACVNVGNLRLKAFAHQGEVAIKQVRQLEELCGEEVIVIHRLLKNHLSEREYLLLTDRVVSAWPQAQTLGSEHLEAFDDIGELHLRVLMPADLPAPLAPA